MAQRAIGRPRLWKGGEVGGHDDTYFYDHSCSLLSTLLSFFPVNQFSLHLSVTLFNQIVNHDIAIGSATSITSMSLILLYCLPLPTG